MSYLSTDEAYEYNDLACWYQNSINQKQPPIWTDEHLEELLNDFYIIPKDTPAADVVPKSEVDILVRDLRFKNIECDQLRERITKAKQEVAREIFEEIERVGEIYENRAETVCYFPNGFLAELEEKYFGKDTGSEGKG